ncbi:MAG: pyruvate kinase [Bdellovibrionales bacterium]|nr:pyruvate kinase [Bdellovibrionales bacterium]
MRNPSRRAKIVCTLGPAVAGLDSIVQLIEAGMDVARLNFSHGSFESHAQAIKWIREASRITQVPVAILGDLQGPKIRTGKLFDATGASVSNIPLKAGQELHFCGLEIGAPHSGDGSREKPISISYPRLALDLRPGDALLFDDGLVRMRVTEKWPDQNLIRAAVEHGAMLGTNKGVNMPGARLTTLGVTEKDWDDVLFGLEQDVDFLAMSFVRTGRDVRQLKTFLDQKKQGVQVVAKIELGEAIANIDEILAASDGIMVARGDLGVEIGNENVPIVQKRLIQKARRAGKPVITATQMLMSMIDNPTPSRAEASDVANAVLDGSDALMLSNETATGKNPFDAVKTMANIILGAETFGAKDFTRSSPDGSSSDESNKPLAISEAIEFAATTLAASLHARCMACLTRSGMAARLLSKYRPQMPIFAFAESEKVRRQLSLSWGVSVIPWQEMKLQDYSAFDDLIEALGKLGLIRHGELAVLTAGIPTSLQVGTTNTVVVRQYPPIREKAPSVGK